MTTVIGCLGGLPPMEITMRRLRRNHSRQLKAKVALEASCGEHTLVEPAALFHVHPNQITQWKPQHIQIALGPVLVPLITGFLPSPRSVCPDNFG